jgi:hypothetical protein
MRIYLTEHPNYFTVFIILLEKGDYFVYVGFKEDESESGKIKCEELFKSTTESLKRKYREIGVDEIPGDWREIVQGFLSDPFLEIDVRRLLEKKFG